MTATIFNIQKFSVHDGPGIRTTVFFKGCPLDCLWCHNPESKSFQQELLHNYEKCTACGRCEQIYERRDKIDSIAEAEAAAERCFHEALEVAGKEYTVAEVMKEIVKDVAFYDDSGGGVTFSGGEAMCQPEFISALAKQCKQKGITVAVDTCGYVPFEYFEQLLPDTDYFLYDIKLMDSELHKEYTGVSNGLILENLRRLMAAKARVILRIPVIEGVNADEGNITEVKELCRELRPERIHLLPYHDIAKGKYKKIGEAYDYEFMQVPTDEKMAFFQKELEEVCANVKIGG